MASRWTSVHRRIKNSYLLLYAFIVSIALFTFLYDPQAAVDKILIPTLSNFTLNYSPPTSLKLTTATSPVTLALILCNDDGFGEVPKSFGANRRNLRQNFQRQINQSVVLLKSIVLQEEYFQPTSSVPVEVLVLSDRLENFQRLDEAIWEEKWPAKFLELIHMTFVPAAYPSGTEWMRKLYRPCATLRLFLDQVLPSYDSVIYIDTDFILLRPISELWSEFSHFTPEALVALAPCLGYYGTPSNLLPFYGTTGLNAGVIPMNLTRIRQSHWFENIRQITQDFGDKIKLADQDILNIYFNATPSELHQLSCDWNFRPPQCQSEHLCLDSQLGKGISALHGHGLSFTNFGRQPIFHSIFSTFQRYNLSSELNELKSSLRREVMRVERSQLENTECTVNGTLSTLLLNRMNSRSRDFIANF